MLCGGPDTGGRSTSHLKAVQMWLCICTRAAVQMPDRLVHRLPCMAVQHTISRVSLSCGTVVRLTAADRRLACCREARSAG